MIFTTTSVWDNGSGFAYCTKEKFSIRDFSNDR